MIYLWGILAFLGCVAALFLTLGLRSRKHQDQYMAVPDQMQGPSPQRQQAEKMLAELARPNARAGTANDSTEPAQKQMPVEVVEPAKPEIAPVPINKLPDHDNDRITGAQQIESEYDEAELMLREVKAMLLQGRPDRAIKYIRSATGVDEHHAADFVADVQARVIG